MIAWARAINAYKLSAVLCQSVSDKRLSVLVEDLGYPALACCGLKRRGAIMLFISILLSLEDGGVGMLELDTRAAGRVVLSAVAGQLAPPGRKRSRRSPRDRAAPCCSRRCHADRTVFSHALQITAPPWRS
jgi:hypothetical protein